MYVVNTPGYVCDKANPPYALYRNRNFGSYINIVINLMIDEFDTICNIIDIV